MSQHLAGLHSSGLVINRKEAQFRYYSCHHHGVILIIEVLKQIF
ncbi:MULTISPECIES: hypothetical protein [Agrobacterium]|nr:hypothetical protein [Agrobacterium tumefaciens]